MALRLRPVRRAFAQSSSYHWKAWPSPRRLVLVFLIAAALYTVYFTSPYQAEPKSEKSPKTIFDYSIDTDKDSLIDRSTARIDVAGSSESEEGESDDEPDDGDDSIDEDDSNDDDSTTENNDDDGVISEKNHESNEEALASLGDTGGDNTPQHRVAGLSCDAYGGPSAVEAREMVYWRDIPIDADFESPLKHEAEEQFLTFEPDEGGWNNMRMSLETAVTMAIAMGRTLVLPPKMRMYRLWDGGTDDRNVIGFGDFFHFESIVSEHKVLKVITFQEFLEQEAMTGRLIDPATGAPSFPPENRTDWTGTFWNFESTRQGKGKPLWEWMRNITTLLEWSFDDCVVGFPTRRGKDAADHISTYLAEVLDNDAKQFNNKWSLRRSSYNGHPTPVNASARDRLSEMLGNRKRLCVYDEKLQDTKVVHGIGETSTGFRLLVHFYAFLFFEDWKQDLWTKRFIRDHFRYIDEINCAAARIVQQVRKKATEFGNVDGLYHSMHVRRGDFQYMLMHLPADEIYNNNTRLNIPDGSTVYVATDEGNKTFFDPFREHYNLLFLDQFQDQIQSINKNYYGMLDQLVASRGEIFWGAFYSTFTGYINRIRGYHAQKEGLNKTGDINSYYYVPQEIAYYRERMRTYHSLEPSLWQQEWPVAWRDIDFNIASDDFIDR